MSLNRTFSLCRSNTPNKSTSGGSSSGNSNNSIAGLLQQDSTLYRTYQQLRKTVTCSICLEVFTSPVTLPCGHSYCKECVQQAIRIRGKCPMCTRSVKVNQWKEENSNYMKDVLEMLRELLVMIDPHQCMISSSQDLLAGNAAVFNANNVNANTNSGRGGNNNSKQAGTSSTSAGSSSSSSSASNIQGRGGGSGGEGGSTKGSSNKAVPNVSDVNAGLIGEGGRDEGGIGLLLSSSSTIMSIPSRLPSLLPTSTNDNGHNNTAAANGGLILSTPRESSSAAPAQSTPAPTTGTVAAPLEADHLPPVPKVTFEIGSLVNVLPRTWSGINRLGGVGRVVDRIDAEEDGISYYRVKYVLDGSHDDNIHELFVEEFKELERGSRRRVAPSSSAAIGTSSLLSTPMAMETGSSNSGGKGSNSDRKRKLTSKDSATPSPNHHHMLGDAEGGGGGEMMSPNRGSSGKKMRPPLPLPTNSSSATGAGIGVAEGGNVGRTLFCTQQDHHYAPSSSSSSSSSSAPYPYNKKHYRLLTTGIDEGPAFDRKLEKFHQLFDNTNTSGGGVVEIELESHFTETATHLIVSVDKQSQHVKQRTMKYMMAIAHGLWIVSTQWIVDSIKHKEIQSEEKYEALGNIKATIDFAPRRSRLAHQEEIRRLTALPTGGGGVGAGEGQQGGLLLSSCNVLLFGGFPLPGPAKSDAMSLITACDASLVTSNSEDFVRRFYEYTLTCDDSAVEYDTLMDTQEEGKTLENWVVICSNCGGCTKEMVSTRLSTLLEQVMAGANPLHTKLILQRVPIVTSVWLIDSVTNYQKLGYEDYLLENLVT